MLDQIIIGFFQLTSSMECVVFSENGNELIRILTSAGKRPCPQMLV